MGQLGGRRRRSSVCGREIFITFIWHIFGLGSEKFRAFFILPFFPKLVKRTQNRKRRGKNFKIEKPLLFSHILLIQSLRTLKDLAVVLEHNTTLRPREKYILLPKYSIDRRLSHTAHALFIFSNFGGGLIIGTLYSVVSDISISIGSHRRPGSRISRGKGLEIRRLTPPATPRGPPLPLWRRPLPSCHMWYVDFTRRLFFGACKYGVIYMVS